MTQKRLQATERHKQHKSKEQVKKKKKNSNATEVGAGQFLCIFFFLTMKSTKKTKAKKTTKNTNLIPMCQLMENLWYCNVIYNVKLTCKTVIIHIINGH